MSILDWLSTPGGAEALHAAVLLVTAAAALLSAWAATIARGNTYRIRDIHSDVKELKANGRTHPDTE